MCRGGREVEEEGWDDDVPHDAAVGDGTEKPTWPLVDNPKIFKVVAQPSAGPVNYCKPNTSTSDVAKKHENYVRHKKTSDNGRQPSTMCHSVTFGGRGDLFQALFWTCLELLQFVKTPCLKTLHRFHLPPVGTQVAKTWPAQPDLGAEGVDSGNHPVSVAFGRPTASATNENCPPSTGNDGSSVPSVASVDKKQEVLFLQSLPFPGDLRAVVDVTSNRRGTLAQLFGVKEDFISLEVGASFNAGTIVKVSMVHPGDESMFRPGRVQDGSVIRRKWDHTEEGAQLVEGATGHNRLLFLVHSFLNGEEIKLGGWVFFITACINHDSHSDALKSPSTTLWLGKVLRVMKKVNTSSNRAYIHFFLAYRSKNGNARYIATTPEFTHSVIPAPFQQMLDLDQVVLVPFTDQDTTCKEMLVKVICKVMKRSEEQSSSNKRSPSGGDTTAEAQTNSSSAALQQTTMQELVRVKGEKKVLEEKLAKLERGEQESQKIVQDTLKLFNEERAKNISLLSQLKVSTSSNNKQVIGKKKHYNVDRAKARFQTSNNGLKKQVEEATRAVEERDLALEKAVEERDAALEQQAEAITARDKAVEAAGVAKKEVESAAVKARGFEIDLAEAQRNLELATVSNKEFKKKVTDLQFKLELIETERDQFKAVAKGARNAMKDLSFSSLSRSPSRRPPSPYRSSHKRKKHYDNSESEDEECMKRSTPSSHHHVSCRHR
eukprot:g30170.t1